MATLYVKAAGGNSNAAGTWSNVSSLGVDNSGPPTSADDCLADLNSGQLTINATLACKTFSATDGVGDYANTLTHNAFTWTISGSCTFVAGMTYTPLATSTIRMDTTGTLTTAGLLMPNITTLTGGTQTLGDNLSFMNSKLLVFTIGASTTFNQNTKSINGNSIVNRILISSATLGTQQTITNMSTSFTNADFMDIAPASGSVDLSGITGGSGDCGGNTNITFTPAATQTYTGASGNWSDNTKWTSRVPLPQDNVLMSGVTGGPIAADMPRLGTSIDWTGATGTAVWAINTVSNTIYGSLLLLSSMGTVSASGTFPFTFGGRGAFTYTSGAKVFSNANINMFGGSLTLAAAAFFNGGTGSLLTLNNGTFNDAGFAVTASLFNSSNANVRAIVRSGLWTITQTATVYTHSNPTNLTLTDTGTVLLSDVSGSSKTFAGGGLIFKDLKLSGGGSGLVIITGANTFNSIYTDGAGTKSIRLPGSTTTTIISGTGLSNGTNVITFTSSAGSATISKASGVLSWAYVNLTNIIAAATGAAYYAGPAPPSVDGGGNTNWTFSNVPSGNRASRNLFNFIWWRN